MQGKIIPDGFQGKLAKIVIQGPQDRHPFVYYATVLREDENNIYVKMAQTELFFRKQYINSIVFPKNNVPEPNPVPTDREAKVVYKIGGKTQVAYGKITETESYIFVELDNKEQCMIMKHSVISISFSKLDAPDKKKDWTDRKPMRTKPNGFSYARWWHDKDVKEVNR